MKRLAVLISGNGSLLQELIDATQSGRIDGVIDVVISSNHTAYGIERARSAGIDVVVAAKGDFDTNLERDQLIEDVLVERDIQLIILAGYLGILGGKIIEKFEGKIINIHPSLLPLHGGKGMFGINVHREVKACGDPFTGATVHFVSTGIDEGSIIAQKRLAVDPSWTAEQMQKIVLEKIEKKLIVDVVKRLCKK